MIIMTNYEDMVGIHSIEYDRLTSFFYLFGVYQEGVGWHSWDKVEEMASSLNIFFNFLLPSLLNTL